MGREFRFRLNGTIIPEIQVQNALIDGHEVGTLQIAVREWSIGWFTIDDNEHLWDDNLPKFVLEYRDETAWSLIPITERRLIKDKGWQKVTTQELLDVLESAGLIK